MLSTDQTEIARESFSAIGMCMLLSVGFFFYRYVFTFLSVVTITIFKDYDCLIFSEFSMKHLNYFFIKRHSLHSYKESVFSDRIYLITFPCYL